MMLYFHRYSIIFEWFYPSYIWRIPTTKKEIYITFDDGPVPQATEYALDMLKQFNAKATFFCVGENIIKHSSIYQRIIDEGHTVGNHTYNHLNARNVTKKTYWENVLKSEEVQKNLERKYFRPPYGRLYRSQMKQLRKEGYQLIMWNVLTGDFDSKLDRKKAVKRSIDAVKPGSIILMHDNIKHFHNMEYILPKFLETLTLKGYSFKALP